MNHNYKAHIANTVSTLLFGIGYWVAKSLMAPKGVLAADVYFSPMQIMFFRTGGAVIFFYLLSKIFRGEEIERKDHWRVAIAALFGISVNQLFYFVGLKLSNPVETSIIHAANPVLVVFFAALILKEGFSKRKVMGLILGLTGSLLLILWGKEISMGSEGFMGNVFILTNVIAYALYLVLIKPVMRKYSPIMVMRWVFLYGFLFLLPFMFNDVRQSDFGDVPMQRWMALAYIVIGTTVITYLLTVYALAHLSASVVGYYIYLQPVIAALIGVMLQKDYITWSKIVAAIFIFYGVYLVSIDRDKYTASKLKVGRWMSKAMRQ